MELSESLARAIGEVTGPQPRCWRVQGLTGGAQAYFLSRILSATPRPSLVISATAVEAERFATDLRFFFGESEDQPPFTRRIHYLPSWDVVPFEDISPPPENLAARIEGLYHLRQTKNPIVVTTPEALLQRVPPPGDFADRWWYLVEGDEVDTEELANRLDAWGYRRL